MAGTTRADLDLRQPFTHREAAVAGLPAHRLKTHRFKQLFRGVYVASEVAVTDELMCRAAVKIVADRSAHVSHLSAARLHGLPVPEGQGEHVTVSWAGARRQRTGLTCHVAPPGALTTWGGMPVSSPDRTFAELAALLPLVDLVIAGDHLVRHALSTTASLELTATNSPLPARSRAVSAAQLVRERIDSPAETRFRLLLHFAGLPELVTNYEVRDDSGHLLRRHDLARPEQRLAFELHGRQHVDVQSNWEAGLGRLEESNAEGWRTVQITGRAVYREPRRVLHAAWRAMRQCGVPGVPAQFHQLSEAWRLHFRG